MTVENFVDILDSDFYTGVPDSQLRPLCDYLIERYGDDARHHIIAANEGNAVAYAAGYHLATGKVPVVYMQNSGIGNAINPVVSLMHNEVYGIPCIFIVGWRGEPGVHDEPQHIFQGQITEKLLLNVGIDIFIVRDTTTEAELRSKIKEYQKLSGQGKAIAFIIAKNALISGHKIEYKNAYELKREEVIEEIVKAADEDIVIVTTGKAGRELFEIRVRNGQGHEHDFLTVGSMGHSSSIAMGIAVQKPDRKIWCIDGDGALLMHMGALTVIGSIKPQNLVHVIINNGAHETVGGMPTATSSMDVCQVALNCGYEECSSVRDMLQLRETLARHKAENSLALIEVKAAIGSRMDLGRPTRSPWENKEEFMSFLGRC